MKDLFSTNQDVILKFLNDYRKYVDIPHIGRNKIIKAFSNGVVQREGKNLKWFFWGKDIITDELLKHDFFPQKSYRYAWLDNPFTSGAGDGHLRAVDGNWTTVRNATTANDNTDYTSTTLRLDSLNNGSNFFLGRGRIVFDTSSLPDAATLTSATVQVECTSVTGSPYSGDTIYLVNVASSLASFTTLTANDYDNFGTTAQSNSQFDCTTTGTKTITLNATGLSAISKTSYTDWGLRTNKDFNNSAPGSTSGTQVLIGTSENSTSAYRPLLTVVTPDEAGGFFYMSL